jgi:hypothetical protein
MTGVRLIIAALLATGVVLAGAGGAASAAERITVTVDRAQVSTKLGKKIVFQSTITNHGSAAARGLIAHLNVLSLRDGTYVDPEDWSSHRTRYLQPIAAGGSITTTWRVEAVNHGSFGVYVAVLPETGTAQAPAISPTVHLLVAQKKTLNAGGIVPLALGVPALLGLLALSLRLRRGRSSRARA